MVDDVRVLEVLDNLDSNGTPEDVCGNDLELLRKVRRLWDRIQRVQHQINTLFPGECSTWRGRSGPGKADGDLPQIDGYAVEGILGSGGMGIVYKAKDCRLDRLVAIKMMLAGPNANSLDLARFRREAEAVAALRHPNIVRILDASASRHYFIMEFVEGGNLAEKLAGKPLDERDAAEMIATVASAIHFMHTIGFIHRDLKPANILLTADGAPKIADFGLAQSIDEGPEFSWYSVRAGTPSYMAPEQAMGKPNAIGPAVDLYALGAVLYEMLTGRPPFKGQSAAETERQVIADEPVPPSRWNPKVSRDLERICLKCLQKSPLRRYASAQGMANDLHRFLDGKAIVTRPVGVIEPVVHRARRRLGCGPSRAVATATADDRPQVTLKAYYGVFHLRVRSAVKRHSGRWKQFRADPPCD